MGNITKKSKELFFSGKMSILSCFSNTYSRIYIIINIAINILLWLIAFLINTEYKTEDLIVLHYNVDFGVSMVGKAEKIFMIPLLGAIIILLNLFTATLVSRIKNDQIFFSHVLFFSSIVCNSFLLFSIVTIYLINFK